MSPLYKVQIYRYNHRLKKVNLHTTWSRFVHTFDISSIDFEQIQKQNNVIKLKYKSKTSVCNKRTMLTSFSFTVDLWQSFHEVSIPYHFHLYQKRIDNYFITYNVWNATVAIHF